MKFSIIRLYSHRWHIDDIDWAWLRDRLRRHDIGPNGFQPSTHRSGSATISVVIVLVEKTISWSWNKSLTKQSRLFRHSNISWKLFKLCHDAAARHMIKWREMVTRSSFYEPKIKKAHHCHLLPTLIAKQFRHTLDFPTQKISELWSSLHWLLMTNLDWKSASSYLHLVKFSSRLFQDFNLRWSLTLPRTSLLPRLKTSYPQQSYKALYYPQRHFVAPMISHRNHNRRSTQHIKWASFRIRKPLFWCPDTCCSQPWKRTMKHGLIASPQCLALKHIFSSHSRIQKVWTKETSLPGYGTAFASHFNRVRVVVFKRIYYSVFWHLSPTPHLKTWQMWLNINVSRRRHMQDFRQQLWTWSTKHNWYF